MGGSSLSVGGFTGGTQKPIRVEESGRSLIDRALATAVRSACTGNRLIFFSLEHAARRQPTRFTWRLANELVRFSLLDIYTRLAELNDSFPGRFATEGSVYERLLKLSQAQDERALLWHGFLLSDLLRDILGPSFRLLGALAGKADLLGEGGPADADSLEQPEAARVIAALPSESVGSATHLSRRLLHEIAALPKERASGWTQVTPDAVASVRTPGTRDHAATRAPQPAPKLDHNREPSRTEPGQVLVHGDSIRDRIKEDQITSVDGDYGPEAGAKGVRVTRHPSIDLTGELRPAKEVTLTVDLALTPDRRTESKGLVIDAPEGWTKLPIHAEITAPNLHFEPGKESGTIVIRNGEASEPYCVKATVLHDLREQDAIEVRATFYYEGRYCGNARRAFPVSESLRLAASAAALMTAEVGGAAGEVQASGPELEAGVTSEKVLGMELPDKSVVPESRREPAPAHYTAGAMMADTVAGAPKLTIAIFSFRKAQQNWHLIVPEKVKAECRLPAKLSDNVILKRNGKLLDEPAYVTDLFRELEALDSGQHMTCFQGLGDELYELTPPCFRELYWVMFDKYGSFPIQILSDDPYMPWELMRPTRPKGDQKPPQTNILGQLHPVGRWFPDKEGLFFARLKRGKVATVAPDYTARSKSLKRLRPLLSAQTDSKAILSALKTDAISIGGRKLDVIGLFEDASKADIALIHYAGHGICKTKQAKFAQLLLEDTDLLVYDIRRKETQLGRNRHPLVFFNACQVGRSGLNLGVIGGFAEALVEDEFGGFIAPLWSVYDVDASTVTQQFLQDILPAPHGGQRTFAAALQRVRSEFGEQSPTFLSYVYYGDVMAKFA